MPRRREANRDVNGIAAHRKQLIDATEGVDLAAGGWLCRISNVPLFQRHGDGEGLTQAIRVRSEGSGIDSAITVRARIGPDTIAEAAPVGAQPSTSYLMVPEVTASTPATIELVSDGSVMASAPFAIEPQRKWTVHLVHHSHYDIGYTDPQTIVLDSQLGFLDNALDLVQLTDTWPDDARFRWNVEVNWPLKQWLRFRPQSARDTFVRRVQEGRIEVHALPFSMHTEAYSFDELARQLDVAQELRDSLGIEIVSAMQTDVPGATIGLATLLTDAGIRYLSVAHNYAGRSIPYLVDGQALTRPFYWEAPDGERLLVWYTDTLSGSAYMEAMSIGFGIGYDEVRDSLSEYLGSVAQNAYPYPPSGETLTASGQGIELTKQPYAHDILHLRVQGAIADNAAPSLLPSRIVRSWNEEWVFPRLRMSTDREFFEDAASRLGDSLDSFRGDWTDWWADGIGSAAFALGRNRRSQANIRTAQTLNALADGLTDTPKPAVPAEVRMAYEELALFDEHTWGAANPWERGETSTASGEYQWVRKASFAFTAEERIDTLLGGGRQRIASLARRPGMDSDADALLVFNPSSWERTDLVEIFIPERIRDVNTCQLIDLSSGAVVPFIVTPQINARHRNKGEFIRFLARGIPGLGYVRYLLTPGSTRETNVDGSGENARMANGHLDVELDLDEASIASISERRGGRILNDPDALYGFNRYIHDRYTSAPGFNHLSSRLGTAGPWLLGARSADQYGFVTNRVSNDVWEQVTIRSSGGGADWLESTLTLPHGVPRLHITNRLHKPVTMEKESVHFAFPFARVFGEPTFEITGGVASPGSPHVPGSANHFRAMRHWATLEAPDQEPVAWATMEAPLVQTADIRIPYAPFPGTLPDDASSPSTIYSLALNNIWDTNFPSQQGGELTFRYAVAVGEAHMPAARLGRDTGASVASPLIGIRAPDYLDATSIADDRGSFVSVSNPEIEISHLAPMGDGGIVVHVVSHAPGQLTTDVSFNLLPVKSARIGSFLGTDLTETELRDGVLHLDINPGEIRTISLTLR